MRNVVSDVLAIAIWRRLLSESVDGHGIEELISPRVGGAQVDERVTCHKVPQHKRIIEMRELHFAVNRP